MARHERRVLERPIQARRQRLLVETEMLVVRGHAGVNARAELGIGGETLMCYLPLIIS